MIEIKIPNHPLFIRATAEYFAAVLEQTPQAVPDPYVQKLDKLVEAEAQALAPDDEGEPDSLFVDAEERDSEGMLWDARIHSSNHKKIGDGTWQLRRGVDRLLVTRIKAEQVASATPAPVVAPQPTSVVAPPPPAAGDAPAFVPPPPPAASPAAGEPVTTFATLVNLVAAAGLQDELRKACSRYQLASPQLLISSRSDLIPTIAKEIGL